MWHSRHYLSGFESKPHPFRLLSSGRTAARRMAVRPCFEALEDRRMMAVDVILEWNDVLLEANANDHSRLAPEQGGPILTARAFAIVSAAMYDAYNSVEHIGEPFLVSVPLASKANSDAAAAQAAHDTLSALFPSQKTSFDTALRQTLRRIQNGFSETYGRVVGALVARRFLADRADDGAGELANNTYLYNGLPGFHKVDPMNPNQGYYASSAMNIDPFAVDDLEQFAARHLDDATPEGRLAFLQSEEYTLAYNEVLALGGDGGVNSPTERTAEQTEIGIYWAYDGRPGLGTPPRLYNQIVRTLAASEHNTEAENARLFALVNVAMADAGLTAWKNKYDDAFWRPIMGIRNGDIDGNPDTEGFANWMPLGAPASNPRPSEINFTPPFPAYTSGHATLGAATFQILTRFYGRDDICFTFVSDELNGVTLDADGTVRPLVSRTFESFTEAKLENAQSRIYLGIHWAFDRDDGIKTGDQVADYVFEHFFEARRVRPPKNDHGRSDYFSSGQRDGDSRRDVAPSNLAEPLTIASPAASTALTAPLIVDSVMSRIGESEGTDDRSWRPTPAAAGDLAIAPNSLLESGPIGRR